MEGREGLKRENETLTTISIHKHTHECIMHACTPTNTPFHCIQMCLAKVRLTTTMSCSLSVIASATAHCCSISLLWRGRDVGEEDMLLKMTLKYTTSVWLGERGEVGFESEDNFHKIHP